MTPSAQPVSETTYAQIRDFLFNEAALLDARRYSDWFRLLTPDIRYRVASHATYLVGTEPKEVLILDDQAGDIELRVKQISTPNLTYTENPAPLMRRFVSNIRIQAGSAVDSYSVESYLLMCRSGGALNETFTFSAVRRDVINRVDGELRLTKRETLIDQTVMTNPNFPTFV